LKEPKEETKMAEQHILRPERESTLVVKSDWDLWLLEHMAIGHGLADLRSDDASLSRPFRIIGAGAASLRVPGAWTLPAIRSAFSEALENVRAAANAQQVEIDQIKAEFDRMHVPFDEIFKFREANRIEINLGSISSKTQEIDWNVFVDVAALTVGRQSSH
jgi:hypothetical protein